MYAIQLYRNPQVQLYNLNDRSVESVESVTIPSHLSNLSLPLALGQSNGYLFFHLPEDDGGQGKCFRARAPFLAKWEGHV